MRLEETIAELERKLVIAKEALRNAYEAMVGSGGFDIDQWTAAVDGAGKALADIEQKTTRHDPEALRYEAMSGR